MTHNIMSRFSTIALIASSIILLIMVGFLFWPINVITTNTQPYKILNKDKTVMVGENLAYEVDACKHHQTTGYVQRKFTNGLIFSTPITTGTVQKGCSKTIVTINVPHELPAGNWHLDIDILYRINFLRDKSYHFRTEDFTVINNNPPVLVLPNTVAIPLTVRTETSNETHNTTTTSEKVVEKNSNNQSPQPFNQPNPKICLLNICL